jgi:Cu-Zn family superoxide dismutase
MRSNYFSTGLLTSAVVIAASLLSCNNGNDGEVASDTAATTETTVAPANTDTASVAMVNHAEAVLSATYPDTAVNGTIKFDVDSTGKVKMTLDMTIPSKAGKSIAVHIHEHGDCSDTAKMAHGHWNPANAQHGKWGSASFHAGDIGNIKLNAKGNGTMTLTTDLWTLGGRPGKNILGKSIIVHGGMDDYTSQPAGNSGSRIGCGVIR